MLLRGSIGKSRANKSRGPFTPLSFSLTAAHACTSCACDACERGRSHAAARVAWPPPPPLPADACRRPRATPEWPYGKLVIVITYEPAVEGSLPPPPRGIEAASALRLVNRSAVPIKLTPSGRIPFYLGRSCLIEQAFRRESDELLTIPKYKYEGNNSDFSRKCRTSIPLFSLSSRRVSLTQNEGFRGATANLSLFLSRLSPP